MEASETEWLGEVHGWWKEGTFRSICAIEKGVRTGLDMERKVVKR